MKVKTTMYKGKLRELSAAQAKAVTMTAMEILNRTRNSGTMPHDTGSLEGESTFVDDSKVKKGEVTIINTALYARRLYYHPEYNFNTSHNANAGGEWWEPWITGERSAEPAKLFKQFYRKLMGGTVH